MCYGSGCPFEVRGYGPSAGECDKPKGAPCFMDYNDSEEFEYILSRWEDGESVSEAAHEWEEMNDDEDSDEEVC